MPRYIVKVGKLYGEWSTITDTPVTALMPLGKFRAYYLRQYGRESMYCFAERLARADAHGTSELPAPQRAHRFVINNYGPKETTLTPRAVVAKWKRESVR